MARVIGKVVKSTSHLDYVVQVFGRADVPAPPTPSEYAVGTFVALPLEQGHLVGVIYDTVLANPEYGSLGPRLSPRVETEVFSPDYLDEKAVQLGVSVLGTVDERGVSSHTLPPLATEVDAEARAMGDAEVVAFHLSPDGSGEPRVGYLPRLLSLGGEVGAGLAHLILGRLAALFPRHQALLRVLRDNVAYRSTVDVLR